MFTVGSFPRPNPFRFASSIGRAMSDVSASSMPPAFASSSSISRSMVARRVETAFEHAPSTSIPSKSSSNDSLCAVFAALLRLSFFFNFSSLSVFSASFSLLSRSISASMRS